MKVVVVAVLLVAAATAQLSSTRDENCKENETFQTCGSACEPSCTTPNPSFCTLQCVVGCQCDKDYLRRSDNACVKKEECNMVTNATAPVAPILPAPNMTCGVNEEHNMCHSPCTEAKCPDPNAPMVNCITMCIEGCSCQKGYVRNTTGVCVKESECPVIEPAENQCNLVDCRSGMKCVIHDDGQPICMPDYSDYSDLPSDGNITQCATVRCASGTECQVLEKNCSAPPCETYPSCVNVTESLAGGCDTMRCGEGETCEEAMVKCAKAPCPRHAMCMPSLIEDVLNETLSSCASVTCPVGETCEETTVQCFVAPCPRLVSCVPQAPHLVFNGSLVGCEVVTCPQGEICEESFIDCVHPPCSPWISCVPEPSHPVFNDSLVGCEVVTCPQGEICEESYVDCEQPPCSPWISCVPQKNQKEVTCQQVTCPTGQSCTSDTSTHLFCSSNSTSSQVVTCQQVTCPTGQVCQMEVAGCDMKPHMTTQKPCLPHLTCVAYETPVDPPVLDVSGGCASVSCPVGESCEETTVQCLMAPCPTAVSCVPMNTNQNSTARQGCDVVRCRVNEICEEQEVQCLRAPCPIQVACVSIIHTNTTVPSDVCPTNQTMSDCLNSCSEAKCPGSETSMMCTKHCGQGCACAQGFVRSNDGECYKPKDCPPEQMCGQNEEYKCEKCAGTCKTPEPNCPGPKNKSCKKKCICAAGFVKKNGKCVTLASCPDHDHTNITCLGTQDFTDCLPKCRQLCSGVQECDKNMSTEMCTPGCVCRGNYKLDSNGTCVHNRHCFKTTECPENEEWSKCISDDNLCNAATILKVPVRDSCFSGCICSTGFARNSNGTCVEQDKC